MTGKTKQKQIYIAGPLFTEGEQYLLEEIDKVCTVCGYKTYLPHRDAGLYDRTDRKKSNSEEFSRKDKRAITASQIIIAVLNGVDVDSGTAVEVEYAHGKGKIILGYVNDTRIFAPEKQINPMVYNSLTRLIPNLSKLEEVLIQDYKK